jgi:phosphotransferase system HPr (HPr) family protein
MSASVERATRLPPGIPLHARPAGRIVKEAARHDATVTITFDGDSANARSILELLALGAEGGAQLMVSASGSEAAGAVEGVIDVIAGFAAAHEGAGQAPVDDTVDPADQ